MLCVTFYFYNPFNLSYWGFKIHTVRLKQDHFWLLEIELGPTGININWGK